MDETERQQWATQVQAVRARADVAARALFTLRHKLDEAAKEWARTANGFPVAQSLRILAEDCSKAWHAAIAEHEADGASADASSPPSAIANLHPRAEATYLNIIGAMLELLRNPRPGRDVSDAAVIRELIDNYSDKPGISKTTLEGKFAEARRRLNST